MEDQTEKVKKGNKLIYVLIALCCVIIVLLALNLAQMNKHVQSTVETKMYSNSEEIGSAFIIALNYTEWQINAGIKNVEMSDSITIDEKTVVTQDLVKIHCPDNSKKLMGADYVTFQHERHSPTADNLFKAVSFISALEYGSPIGLPYDTKIQYLSEASKIFSIFLNDLQEKKDTLDIYEHVKFYSGKFCDYYYYIDQNNTVFIKAQ